MTRFSMKRLALTWALFLSPCGQALLCAQPAVEGDWSSVFTWGQGGGYEAIHVHMLPTGKVMFWQTWRESTGLWDPVTNQFSAAAFPLPSSNPTYNPFCSGHAWLPDGRLMVVGGHIENNNGLNRANIYNPFTNTWANNVPNMPSIPTGAPYGVGRNGRWYPSVTTLGNGDILTLSGDMNGNPPGGQPDTNPLPQVYSPSTNSWRNLTTAYKVLPLYPRTFLAPDGRVVSLSGYGDETEFLDTAGTGSWEYLEDTLDPNIFDFGAAVMYDTGQIAYFGGGYTPTANVSLLDLNVPTPSWIHATDTMAQPRRQNNATILADGTVLITGGSSVGGFNDPNGLVTVAELWDPITQQVEQVAEANPLIYRGYHSTGLLLPDGRVLVTGGDHDSGGFQQNLNAEIYTPAYLFADDGSPAVRPTVTSAPDVVELGDTIFIETPNAAVIAKALWVVPGSVTHGQNWTQRANVFELGDELSLGVGGVNITLPGNGNEAPVGYYMLFLVDNNGVPSIAEWVRATPNLPPLSPADFDDDGDVDGDDLVIMQGNYGLFGLGQSEGDTDEDGDVDGRDFLAWQQQYTGPGSLAASVAVPEPGGCLLLLIAALSQFAFRRGE